MFGSRALEACEKFHKRLASAAEMPEDPKRPTRPSPDDDAPTPWALAGLGMQFFVAVLLFAYVGNWMDTRFGTSPLFVLAGVIGGGGSSFYLSYRRLMRKVKSTSGKGSDNDSSPRS